MQLNVWIVGVALACPTCHCTAPHVVRETFGAPRAPAALLARRAASSQTPTAVPSTMLGTGDPSLTEAIAMGPQDVVGPLPPDAAQVEMATANDMLVRLAVENLTSFESVVMRNLELICMVPASQLAMKLQSDLGAASAPVVTEAPVLADPPPHPRMSLLQTHQKGGLRRARSHARAAARSRINLTAVMFVVYIMPPNVTIAKNETNATNSSCPPCQCGPTGPTCQPPFCGLSANETALLQGRSADSIAADLVGQARGGDTPLHGLLPLTTARLPGQNFPAISKTSLAIASRRFDTSAESDTGRSVEATELNEGTQQLIKELRERLMVANQRRADLLTGAQAEPLAFDGFKVPVAAGDSDPWSTLDFSPETDMSVEGRNAARR